MDVVHLQQLWYTRSCWSKIFYVSMHLMGAPLCRAELSYAQLLHITFCFLTIHTERWRERELFSSARWHFCTVCHAWNIFTKMLIATCITVLGVCVADGLAMANNDIFLKKKKLKIHKAKADILVRPEMNVVKPGVVFRPFSDFRLVSVSFSLCALCSNDFHIWCRRAVALCSCFSRFIWLERERRTSEKLKMDTKKHKRAHRDKGNVT